LNVSDIEFKVAAFINKELPKDEAKEISNFIETKPEYRVAFDNYMEFVFAQFNYKDGKLVDKPVPKPSEDFHERIMSKIHEVSNQYRT